MKLKKILALALSLAMVLSIVPAFGIVAGATDVGSQLTLGGITYNVLSGNLVSNGTFEENTDGWISWTGSHDTLGKFSRSTNQAHSGSYSLKSDVNGGGSSDGSLVGQFDLDADAKAGDKYILSFWFYSNNDGLTLTLGLGSDKSTAQVDIACGGLGNSGSDPISCNVSGKPKNQWYQIAYVLTAKADSTYAEIYARWLGTDSYFDDVELYKVEQVSTEKVKGDEIVIDGAKYTVTSEGNLIENGSFEDASGNFDTTGWLSQQKNTDIPNPTTASDDHWVAGSVYSYYYMNAESSLGAQYDRWGTKYTGPRVGNPTNGNWYLMSQWSDNFGGLCCIKRSFGLTAGKKYVLQYDIKSNSGNKTASTVYVGTTLAEGSGTAAGDITEDWKTVSYIVDATDEVNTLWFNAYSLGNGICFDNFRLYEIEVPSTSVEVTATYTLNGTAFATEKKVYDSVDSPDGAVFPAKSYTVDGSSEFYYTAGATLKADGEIPMSLIENPGTYKIDDIVINNGNKYRVKSANLIPNGDFSYGLDGWYGMNLAAPTASTMTLNGDGTVTTTYGGSSHNGSLHRAWSIKSGETYLFTQYTNSDNAFQVLSMSNVIGTGSEYTGDGEGGRSIAGVGDPGKNTEGAIYGNPVAGEQNNYVFTNEGGFPYVKVNYRWGPVTVGNFGLYELEFVEAGKETVINYVNGDGQTVKTVSDLLFDGDAPLKAPAQEVYFAPKTGTELTDDGGNTLTVLGEGKFYDLPAAEANVGETKEVPATASTTKIGVIKDASVKKDSSDIYGIDNDNSIRVASTGSEKQTDANGESLATAADKTVMGNEYYGLLEFPTVELADGQKAMLTVCIDREVANKKTQMNRNAFNKTIGPNNTVIDYDATVKFVAYVMANNNWPEDTNSYGDGSGKISYSASDITAVREGTSAIYSKPAYYTSDEVTFDVTDAMKAAKAAGLETLDLRLAAAYGGYTMVDREKANCGASEYSPYANKELHEGKAAYIEVVDAGAFEVTAANGSATLTKNGSAMSGTATVAAGDDVRLVSEGAVVVTAVNGKYRPNTNLNLTAATDFGEINGYAFGINMAPGAAVRLGAGVTAENKIASDSGIRFIATIDSTSNITNAADQVGIVITAEGNTQEVEIPAVNYQDATTFTAALTNLNQSNYIRKFTATPYATVTFVGEAAPVTFKGNEIDPANESTRSIYEVSALGLTQTPVDEIGKTVKDVMNAYVNSVGIRLTRTGDGMFARDAKLGDTALFTVEQSGTTVTITPVNANVDLKAAEAWWIDYVRINNNNKTARNYISNPQFDETTGALTFTFEEPAAEQTTEPTTDPAA